MQIGNKIERIRKLKGYSQVEVAEKLFISPRAYSDIENDKTKLDLERLESLANIYEMDQLDLLTFDDKQIFNQCSLSGNNYSTVTNIPESAFQNERLSYKQQIKHLEEVEFLRKVINK